jgi:hypothetical protein
MADKQVLEADALVRPECRPASRDALHKRASHRSGFPPGMATVMLGTTCVTFMSLTGTYSLLF